MEKMSVLARLEEMFPQARKNTLREMVETKRVRINGTTVRSLKQEVGADETFEVLDTGTPVGSGTTLLQGLKLVHFDSEIVVVEKPAGLITSSDAQERRPTAWRILRDYFRRQNHKNQVHLIHRLDRDASGLLVFARTWDAYASLKQQFFEHSITRQYDVIVHRVPKKRKARLEHLLIENEYTGEVRVTEDMKKGKLAILDYEVLRDTNISGGKIAHLRCTLFTGRKHQIRVQMKAIGHAVCGDPVYGKSEEPPGRLALHASKLVFEHPRTKKQVAFESRMPGGFEHLFKT